MKEYRVTNERDKNNYRGWYAGAILLMSALFVVILSACAPDIYSSDHYVEEQTVVELDQRQSEIAEALGYSTDNLSDQEVNTINKVIDMLDIVDDRYGVKHVFVPDVLSMYNGSQSTTSIQCYPEGEPNHIFVLYRDGDKWIDNYKKVVAKQNFYDYSVERLEEILGGREYYYIPSGIYYQDEDTSIEHMLDENNGLPIHIYLSRTDTSDEDLYTIADKWTEYISQNTKWDSWTCEIYLVYSFVGLEGLGSTDSGENFDAERFAQDIATTIRILCKDGEISSWYRSSKDKDWVEI